MSAQVASHGKRRRQSPNSEPSVPSSPERAKRHNSGSQEGRRLEQKQTGSRDSRGDGNRQHAPRTAPASLGRGGGGGSGGRPQPLLALPVQLARAGVPKAPVAANDMFVQVPHAQLRSEPPAELARVAAPPKQHAAQPPRQAAASPVTPQGQGEGATLEQLRAKVARLEEENKRYSRKYHETKEQLRQSSEERNAYKAERNNLLEELQEARRLHLGSVEDMQAERAQRQQVERDLNRQLAKVQCLEEDVQSLAEENDTLTDAHAELQSEQEAKDEELSQLEDQLARVEIQLFEESSQRAAEAAAAERTAWRLANMQGRELDNCTVERLETLADELEGGLRKVRRALVRRELQASVPESVECKVCMADPFDTCLVPCGHVFCQACSARSPACPVCRTHVRKRIRIYV